MLHKISLSVVYTLLYARVHCLKEIGEFFWLLYYIDYQSLKYLLTLQNENEKKKFINALTQSNDSLSHTHNIIFFHVEEKLHSKE